MRSMHRLQVAYVLAIVSCAQAVAAAVSPPLVAHWDFEGEDEALGLASDRSPPGTSRLRLKGRKAGDGPQFCAFGDGRGLEFDAPKGTIAQVIDPAEFDDAFPNGLTIDVTFSFVWPEGARPAVATLVSRYQAGKGEMAARSFSLHLSKAQGQKADLFFTVMPEGEGANGVTVNAWRLEAGRPYRAVAVFRPGHSAGLYVDGKLRGRKALEFTSLYPSRCPVALGCRYYHTSPVNFFNGTIGEVKVYAGVVPPSADTKPDEGKPRPSARRIHHVESTVQVPPNWSFEGAEGRENEFRGEYVLNGTWRYLPFPAAGATQIGSKDHLYRNVPCQKLNTYAEAFHVRDRSGRLATAAKDGKGKSQRLTGEGPCLLEREFTIPSSWASRRVFVEFYDVVGDGQVFVNGKSRGYLLEHVSHALPLDARAGERVRLTVSCKSIPQDVWLRSYPRGPQVDETYVTTSWRDHTLSLKVMGSAHAEGAEWRLLVSENPDMAEPALSPAAAPLGRGAADGSWQVERQFGWDDPKLWNLEQPNFYYYVVEVLGRTGRVVDRTLPRRFAFREFWIDGGDFYLNGIKTRIRSLNTVGVNRGVGIAGDEACLRQMLRGYKRMGLNAFSIWRSIGCDQSKVLSIADEEGLLVIMFTDHYGPFSLILDSPEVKEFLEARTASLVRRYREHPSLAIWFMHGVCHAWDYCPAKLDGSYDPVKIWPNVERCYRYQMMAKRTTDKYDGTRPVSFHSGGNASVIHTTMGYMNYDFDLQERENWPLRWAETRHKPLMPSEFSFPFNSALYTRTNRSNYPRAGSLPLVVESSAMYLGESPYLTEPDHEVGQWTKRDWVCHLSPGPNIKRAKAIFAKHTLRSWRTYGMSLQIHGEVQENAITKEPVAQERRDPRHSGAQADQITWREADATAGPVARAVRDNLQPTLAYIGGTGTGLGGFTNKDHVYRSGETVEKTLVVINDRPEEIQFEGRWALERAGVETLSSEIEGSVAAGEIARQEHPIRFTAPDVEHRIDFLLKVVLMLDGRRVLDTFPLTVLPRETPALRLCGMELVLFDPAGETRDALRRAEVALTELGDGETLSPSSLLVVGRRALERQEWAQQLERAGFDRAVSQGLRVLVFEQATSNLLGLKTEDTYTRRAFVAAAGHPALAGLRESDFTYLRGDSDLTEAYPDPGPPPLTNPLRYWKWGNDNIVSSFPIVRPQMGASRALLVSGFDLMESPLLESVRDRGRIVFCQVDVTNRYGRDPVSTRLVHNLLSYLATALEPDRLAQPPVLTGSDLAKRHRQRSEEVEAFRFAKPSGECSWGITASDLFFRTPVKLQCHVKDGEQAPALISSFLCQGDRVLISGLDPSRLTTGWQKFKALRALAALRINSGATTERGPSFAALRDPLLLYPVEWLEGFVHPYDHWRW